MSIRDLAARAGVAEHTIISLEHEDKPRRPSTMRKVADALGVSVRELKGEPEPTSLYELTEDLPDSALSLRTSYAPFCVVRLLYKSTSTTSLPRINI